MVQDRAVSPAREVSRSPRWSESSNALFPNRCSRVLAGAEWFLARRLGKGLLDDYRARRSVSDW